MKALGGQAHTQARHTTVRSLSTIMMVQCFTPVEVPGGFAAARMPAADQCAINRL
jgi:hypothetical protein